MKKIVFMLTLAIMASFTLKAQPETPLVLKNNTDSISYVIGEVAAFHLMQQGLGGIKLNPQVFSRSVVDMLAKKKPMINDSTANALLNKYMLDQQAENAKANIEEGKKFLAQNKLKPGVITTSSGLQYEVIKMGTGIKPTLVDTFVVNYRGTLLNGTEFDASANRGQPLTYPVANVVTGWQEGLQLMPVGSKFKFYIPYNLGYGTADQGKIPPGSTLIFDLELLDVKKRK